MKISKNSINQLKFTGKNKPQQKLLYDKHEVSNRRKKTQNIKQMTEIDTIEKILSTVKSKLDAHNEFKQEYNSLLAFDFNLFNFFNVGENKVSEILAYFLNNRESHGQGNIFLNEFVNQFWDKEIIISNPKIICEKVITENTSIRKFFRNCLKHNSNPLFPL